MNWHSDQYIQLWHIYRDNREFLDINTESNSSETFRLDSNAILGGYPTCGFVLYSNISIGNVVIKSYCNLIWDQTCILFLGWMKVIMSINYIFAPWCWDVLSTSYPDYWTCALSLRFNDEDDVYIGPTRVSRYHRSTFYNPRVKSSVFVITDINTRLAKSKTH